MDRSGAPHQATTTTMPRPRPTADRALRRDRVVWLSSVQDDGRPHLAPIWFHWDGEQIVAFSKPNARKVRNMRGDRRVMLAVGTPGVDFDVELIDAEAHLPEAHSAEVMPRGFSTKYRSFLRRAGMTARGFANVYSQPIVLRPVRYLGYGGRVWTQPGAVAS